MKCKKQIHELDFLQCRFFWKSLHLLRHSTNFFGYEFRKDIAISTKLHTAFTEIAETLKESIQQNDPKSQGEIFEKFVENSVQLIEEINPNLSPYQEKVHEFCSTLKFEIEKYVPANVKISNQIKLRLELNFAQISNAGNDSFDEDHKYDIEQLVNNIILAYPCTVELPAELLSKIGEVNALYQSIWAMHVQPKVLRQLYQNEYLKGISRVKQQQKEREEQIRLEKKAEEKRKRVEQALKKKSEEKKPNIELLQQEIRRLTKENEQLRNDKKQLSHENDQLSDENN